MRERIIQDLFGKGLRDRNVQRDGILSTFIGNGVSSGCLVVLERNSRRACGDDGVLLAQWRIPLSIECVSHDGVRQLFRGVEQEREQRSQSVGFDFVPCGCFSAQHAVNRRLSGGTRERRCLSVPFGSFCTSDGSASELFALLDFGKAQGSPGDRFHHTKTAAVDKRLSNDALRRGGVLAVGPSNQHFLGRSSTRASNGPRHDGLLNGVGRRIASLQTGFRVQELLCVSCSHEEAGVAFHSVRDCCRLRPPVRRDQHLKDEIADSDGERFGLDGVTHLVLLPRRVPRRPTPRRLVRRNGVAGHAVVHERCIFQKSHHGGVPRLRRDRTRCGKAHRCDDSFDIVGAVARAFNSLAIRGEGNSADDVSARQLVRGGTEQREIVRKLFARYSNSLHGNRLAHDGFDAGTCKRAIEHRRARVHVRSAFHGDP
mmetsp:Transcript_10206/g.31494  ORF Transcript_10206/g.31494 Transcript_10206/m.31494 type:complete len:428 (+) Transcript_10206:2970-4253(+)